MRAIHCVIGCTLFIAGIGSVAAASAETRDLGGAPQTTHDSGSASSNGAGGGDAMGLNRDCPSASGSGSSTSASGGGNDRGGGGATAPLPSHRPHLGWQSLLPGSIQ